VLNVVTGERWSTVPDEVVLYLYEHYGTPPAPPSEEVKGKVFGSEQGKRLANWERPQPTLEEVRAQYGGPKIGDEELLLRYLVPEEDLAAARAAGPVKPTYDYQDEISMNDLLDHLMTLKRPRQVHVRRPDGEIMMIRAPS
jgi:oxaloacetate decarboxylase alpha subunit